jgi:hypothetical protein
MSVISCVERGQSVRVGQEDWYRDWGCMRVGVVEAAALLRVQSETGLTGTSSGTSWSRSFILRMSDLCYMVNVLWFSRLCCGTNIAFTGLCCLTVYMLGFVRFPKLIRTGIVF